MFSFQFYTRTMFVAAAVSGLIAAPTHPLMAAQSQMKAVMVEKIGDAKSIDDSARPAADTVLHLTFAVKSAAESQIAAFVNSQSDPSSPNYHKWLTPKQFGAKFGASASDIAAVSSYMSGSNFSNVKVWSNGLFVSGDVSRSVAEKEFGVNIHGYDRPASTMHGFLKSYYAPDQAPKLSADIAEKLNGMYGLSNYGARIPAQSKKAVTPDIATNGSLDPSDLSTAYNIAPMQEAGNWGKGVTIAIFSPTLYPPTDVATFFTDKNLPMPSITPIIVNGGPVIITSVATTGTTTGTTTVITHEVDKKWLSPAAGTTTGTTTTTTTGGVTTVTVTTTSDTGVVTTTVYTITPDYSGEDEADLDLETAGSQAQQATFDVYEGPNDGSLDIFNQIAEDNNAQIVSSSWGGFEDSTGMTQTFADSYDDIRAQMIAEGMTIFVASGDDGAYDPDTAEPSVTVDASSSYVTAVGGTELTLGANSVWQSEAAWTFNDMTAIPDIGSNGGLSIYYPIPVWQAGPGVNTSLSDGFRQVPDVAALAGVPGYDVYITDPTSGASGFDNVYGTSGATPLWASAFAIIEGQLGAREGNINPYLYYFGENYDSVFHDITSGNNGVYTCTPGWDFVTGWGSADFTQLLHAFQGTVAPTATATSYHGFGTGLQMITVPYSYGTTDLTTKDILEGLNTSSGAPSFEIAAWLPLDDSYAVTPQAPANVPVPGQGYWARFSTALGGSLVELGSPVNSLTSSIGLAPGWNMIGNPYLSSVNISSLQFETSTGTLDWQEALTSGDISPELYGYDGSGYVAYSTGDTLAPWAGYWIYSAVSADLVFTSP